MTAPRETWHLPTRRLGRRVLVYDRLDSTNTLAASLADDSANDGLVVVADQQTAGRGQHGRTWQSPAGSSVLLSVLCFPPPALRRPAVLTAWAAVAVCETVEYAAGVAATIKWPNDVLVSGRKVCGILTEQGRGTVVGVGLNVRQAAPDFIAAGLPHATSLAQHTEPPPAAADVARLLIERLDAYYDRLLAGDLATLEAAWRDRLGLLGEPVAAECVGGTFRGRLLELGFDGLCLAPDDGPVRLLAPEAVQQLRPS
jgi:BirA family biotin operon repressor/biotin-[acetyl-CoA-carboxylase] ligase